MARATRIVGIGGSTRPGSLTEQLVRGVMAQFPEAERLVFAGPDLDFPFYGNKQSDAGARRFVESVAEADALVVGSPGYHGTMSGLVKNALDHLEDLSCRTPAYLDGKVVACVATAQGWQAAVNTLTELRQTISALRGWSTPYGLALNVADGEFTKSDHLDVGRLAGDIDILVSQVRQFLKSVGS
jgi:FMN reductase